MPEGLALTVEQALRQVFPNGAHWESVPPPAGLHPRDLSIPPFFPPDLFAAAQYLLVRSGAYNFVVAGAGGSVWPGCCVPIAEEEFAEWKAAGTSWSREPKVPEKVSKLWAELWADRDSPVYKEPGPNGPAPQWWRPCYALMAIADEACVDVGYLYRGESVSDSDDEVSWIVDWVDAALRRTEEDKHPSDGLVRLFRHVASIALKADRDVICVLPKARTPDVGCTVRSLSHNLSTLPPRAQMRAHWQRPLASQIAQDRYSLNLLVIPFPFDIEPDCFTSQQAMPAAGEAVSDTMMPWGWFTVEQRWLAGREDKIVQLVVDLIGVAIAEGTPVHGVILPEYALDWRTYEMIAHAIKDKFPDIDFFVAGSSNNCEDIKGNWALSAQFTEYFDEEAEIKRRRCLVTSRAKHHRWRIDASQIGVYGLAHALPVLNEDVSWWEKIALPQREIHIMPMRSASVFTVLICEDLARSDPCHEVVRALGPNLVIVLLMDGPQLEARWPGRYATGLAEDPGSSVLTLTSRGLVARSYNPAANRSSWSIGLWKQEGGRATELNCPPPNHGMVLHLEGVRVTEATLDGRQDTQSYNWRLLHAPMLVSLPEDTALTQLKTPLARRGIIERLRRAFRLPPSREDR